MTTRKPEAITARWLAAGSFAVCLFHVAAGRGPSAVVALFAAGLAYFVASRLNPERHRPAMSKPNKKRFKLETIRQVQADKRGSVIEIETDDGQVFALPAPGFWPDEASALMRDRDEVGLARVLVGGPEEYDRFKAAGGRASDVALAIAAFADDQGVTSGESGASSSS